MLPTLAILVLGAVPHGCGAELPRATSHLESLPILSSSTGAQAAFDGSWRVVADEPEEEESSAFGVDAAPSRLADPFWSRLIRYHRVFVSRPHDRGRVLRC